MAFEGLTSKLQEALRKLKSKGKLTEKDIKTAMREVKLALLEADVNYKIVREFINNVSEKCVGKNVMESLTPAQQVIKIVNDELTKLMGGSECKINYSKDGFTKIMLVGLQGAGKTTMAGKLALKMRRENKKPLLVACDVYRPAAIKQLEVVGKQVDIPVFSMGNKATPLDIAKASVKYAKENKNDVLIIDTAGRLQIDETMMDELKELKDKLNLDEILLVVDAMTGQEAVNVAKEFNDKLDISGVILTKLDGDTRGGAALSIKAVTKKPIKFVGTGEKLNDIEIFYPDRMASRILGMGDILSLIEKAEASIDKKKAQEISSRMINQEFNFQDFLELMSQMKKLGPLSKIVEMIPGVNQSQLKNVDLNESEKELLRTEAIINSMTQRERLNPSLIMNSASRKKRIARGSGNTIQQVNRLLKQYKMMKKMMKQAKTSKKSFKNNIFGKLPF